MIKKIFIANWKMYISCRSAEIWLRSYLPEIKLLLEKTQHELAIAPSYEALYPLTNLITHNSSLLKLAAQNCSFIESGAYTGQVSVLSLKELGCSYCIIGHNETRMYLHESNATIASKVGLLLDNNIIPVICIGETAHERASRKTFFVLEEQLMHIITMLKKKITQISTICFAYEPVWAIGGNVTPYAHELSETISFIKELLNKEALSLNYKLFYGGNVNEHTISIFSDVQGIDGYLIGRGSLDFQVLKKIVLF